MGDVSMGTARVPWNDDIQMETAKGGSTIKQGGLPLWERELLESSEIKRKAIGETFIRVFEEVATDVVKELDVANPRSKLMNPGQEGA